VVKIQIEQSLQDFQLQKIKLRNQLEQTRLNHELEIEKMRLEDAQKMRLFHAGMSY
jgi:hypothetical protein